MIKSNCRDTLYFRRLTGINRVMGPQLQSSVFFFSLEVKAVTSTAPGVQKPQGDMSQTSNAYDADFGGRLDAELTRGLRPLSRSRKRAGAFPVDQIRYLYDTSRSGADFIANPRDARQWSAVLKSTDCDPPISRRCRSCNNPRASPGRQNHRP